MSDSWNLSVISLNKKAVDEAVTSEKVVNRPHIIFKIKFDDYLGNDNISGVTIISKKFYMCCFLRSNLLNWIEFFKCEDKSYVYSFILQIYKTRLLVFFQWRWEWCRIRNEDIY